MLNTVDFSGRNLVIKDNIVQVGDKSFKVEGETQDANVYIYKNKSPYIRIELENELLIYNDKNSNDTKKTYKNLCKIRNSQLLYNAK